MYSILFSHPVDTSPYVILSIYKNIFISLEKEISIDVFNSTEKPKLNPEVQNSILVFPHQNIQNITAILPLKVYTSKRFESRVAGT